MDNRGFIKIHRKLLKWEWYQDINTKVLFLHLLLSANWEDRRWQGRIIERGQYVSTISKLSKEIGLTVKQIRRSLDNLLESGEVVYQGTNRFSIYTVVNYSIYQSTGTFEDKPRANRGQTKSCDIREVAENEGKQKASQRTNSNLSEVFIDKDSYDVQGQTEDKVNDEFGTNKRQTEGKQGATIKEVKEVKKYPPIVPLRVDEGEDLLAASFSPAYESVLECWRDERQQVGLATGLIGKNSKTGAMKLAAAIDRGEATLQDAKNAIHNLLANPEKRESYSLAGLVNNFEIWVNRSPPEQEETVQLNRTREVVYYSGVCSECNYSVTGFDEGDAICPKCKSKIKLRKEV